MSQEPELSVVLPALDESAGLRVLLPRLRALFEKLGVRGEILVVDGGSSDDTVAVAEAHGARVLRQKGRGFGSAVREGLRAARAERVALMDADGSHAPEALESFWARRADAELIVGSRYCRGGSAQMPLMRQVLSRALNMASRRVLDLPVRESSSGFRLYHGPSARAVRSDATDFSVQQDLMVGILAAGGRVIELPIHYAPRVGGASKANAWKLAPAYVRLLLRLKKLRGGWRAEAGLFAVLALGLLTGLCGIFGGLPGAARWRALPEAARGAPEFSRKLADAWNENYAQILRAHSALLADEPSPHSEQVVRVPAGWAFPTPALVNSARSLLTQSDNPDEKKTFIILSRMRPRKLDFKPLYVQYGGAFVYPFGVWLGLAHAARLARLTPDLAYYLTFPDAMGRLYRLGRLYILLFHLGTIVALYELGRMLAGRRAGAAAAALFALAPLVIVQSHVLKPHPVAAFWFVIAGLFAAIAAERGRPIDHLACGVAAGLGAGANLTLAFGAALPLLARLVGGPGGWAAPLVGAAAATAVAAGANPYLLTSPRDYAWELTVYFRPHFSAAPRDLFALIARSAPRGMGAACGALVAFGVFCAFFSSDRRRRALALACAGGAALLWLRVSSAGGSEATLRFFYGPFALSCALAGAALIERPRPIAALLLAAALAESGLRSAVYLANLSRGAGSRSTRSAAADWIDAHVPAGAEVGLLRPPEPSHTPPFRWDRVALTIFESTGALAGAAPPEWVVASGFDLKPLAIWMEPRYETAAAFPPVCFLGVCPTDDAFFSNLAMTVLRRRVPAAAH